MNYNIVYLYIYDLGFMRHDPLSIFKTSVYVRNYPSFVKHECMRNNRIYCLLQMFHMKSNKIYE